MMTSLLATDLVYDVRTEQVQLLDWRLPSQNFWQPFLEGDGHQFLGSLH